MKRIHLPPLRTVHIWSVDLDCDSKYSNCLNTDESERSSRFRRKLHADRYTRGRIALRWIIGQYLNMNPISIQFKYRSNGKPYLNSSPNEPSVFFNLTHSEEQMLAAFSTTDEIGLDVEKTREFQEESEIVKSFFSKQEAKTYVSLPLLLKTQGFLNAWTRKEAIVKATGAGLQTPLNSFSVSLDPRKPCQINNFSNLSENSENWSLIDVSTHPIYTAALASKTKIKHVKFLDFNNLVFQAID